MNVSLAQLKKEIKEIRKTSIDSIPGYVHKIENYLEGMLKVLEQQDETNKLFRKKFDLIYNSMEIINNILDTITQK